MSKNSTFKDYVRSVIRELIEESLTEPKPAVETAAAAPAKPKQTHKRVSCKVCGVKRDVRAISRHEAMHTRTPTVA